MIFVGDDWAEDHHDVHLMDENGRKLAAKRLAEGVDGVAALHELIAAHTADRGQTDPGEVVVGIETDRGLWVNALKAAGYTVFAINPLAAARYRDRHAVSGAKSDPGDAKMLADLVRTDRHNHREIAGDSTDVAGIKILARTHQNLIWDRTRHTNTLRSTLREYYPAALDVFGQDLHHHDALAILTLAPTPDQGAKLTVARIITALRKAGRQRNLDKRAGEIQGGLRIKHLQAPAPVTAAFAASTTALVSIIARINEQVAALEAGLAEHFEQHPDADIYRSLPGLGLILGARVLGEFGDDPERFTDAKSRKNYAGTSPITIASGKKRAVLARHVRNRRLYDALDAAAFAALGTSPGARTFYDERRAAGDLHHQALRALANRLVGILHGCLKHHTRYDETTAWAHRQKQIPIAA